MIRLHPGSPLRGFTLIELLIVIAIILILIAIALPNFLEAQLRAKVVRVQADQRSVRVALESYYADRNDYPYWGSPYTVHWHYVRLTTPIAFITEIPPDIFTHDDIRDAYSYFDYLVERECVVDEGACTNLGSQVDMGSGSAIIIGRIASSNVLENVVGFPNGVAGRPVWYIGSNGPDYEHEGLSDGGLRYIYTATNGTKSKGDIITIGP